MHALVRNTETEPVLKSSTIAKQLEGAPGPWGCTSCPCTAQPLCCTQFTCTPGRAAVGETPAGGQRWGRRRQWHSERVQGVQEENTLHLGICSKALLTVQNSGSAMLPTPSFKKYLGKYWKGNEIELKSSNGKMINGFFILFAF